MDVIAGDEYEQKKIISICVLFWIATGLWVFIFVVNAFLWNVRHRWHYATLNQPEQEESAEAKTLKLATRAVHSEATTWFEAGSGIWDNLLNEQVSVK